VAVRILWYTKSRRAQTNTDYETWIEGGAVPTLNAFDNGDVRSTTLITDTKVRRLTPIECERLQGFPDNWTASQSDSNRYKQMGNAVTVNVIEWIGKRLESPAS
jgi:DNA (cytosine-5)-methyltransferase 1